ncbi:TonB-dependent receptor family protein [Fodinibius halophilus]|uniref:TonB-dependent receptor n=1 Tax=Fodinibius halophilus TaxID=1736908 RepID=A0A6M1TCF5_9BACT|nr:TonB-dependent receptor [Fodinibius halophilus]NGP87902.1 TonB-dependent receptor [Fodinibius halophilus]
MIVLLSIENFNKLFIKALILFSISVLCYHNAFSQSNKDSLTVKLDPITITAIQSTISTEAAPLSFTTAIRNNRELNQSASLSLKTVTTQLPGLWVGDRNNYALGEKLTIRGIGWRAAYGVRGIQVILNGIPLTVADGQTMINIVDPAFIRRAEVVRGPAATYWGNSSGGVLYLSTTPSHNNDSHLRMRTMGGSFGMRKAEVEYSISNPDHQMAIHSSYLTSDGFRNYSGVKMLRSGITGKTTLTSKSQLKYQAGAIYMPKAQHPSSLKKQQAKETPTMARSLFADSAKAGKTIGQGQAGLSYILNTPAGLLNITGYGIYRDLSNPLPFGIITVNRWAGGLRATIDKSWENLDLQMGLESKLQNDDRTEFENIGNAQRGTVTVDQIERVWNQAAFINSTYSLGNINFMGGIRFDRLTFEADADTNQQAGKRTFQSLSPSIGISYTPSTHTIFTNISTSFEAPTTTELVNRPGNGNGFNPSLKPEKTLGLEVGIRNTKSSSPIIYDIATYRLWVKDMLLPYKLSSDGPTYYRNQGQTTHTGVEGRVAVQFNPSWQFSTTANVTKAIFKDALNDDITGNEVPGIPKFRLNNKLKWTSGTFSGDLTYIYNSGYAANNKNSAYNDRYGVVNIKLSYLRSITDHNVRFQPFINIENLLNTRYNGSVVVNAYKGRYYEPAPGRNWQLGVSIAF